MIEFLLSSVVASIALTVVINVILRLFPGTSADARARQVVGEWSARVDEMPSADDAGRLRVYFPWRQILLGALLIGGVLYAARLLG